MLLSIIFMFSYNLLSLPSITKYMPPKQAPSPPINVIKPCGPFAGKLRWYLITTMKQTWVAGGCKYVLVVGNIFVLYISVVRAIYRCFLLQFPLRPKQRGEHANRVWRRRCLLCQPHSMVALYFDNAGLSCATLQFSSSLEKEREGEERGDAKRQGSTQKTSARPAYTPRNMQ